MIKLQSKPSFVSIILLTLLFAASACNLNEKSLTENQKKLSSYNVIWDSPSKDHTGSMPIGNGDIGLNVWAEANGDFCFYIGKTDSWGDNGRLLKVGMVRISCEPAIDFSGGTFRQELDLNTGIIKIHSSGIVDNMEIDFKLNLWVDANNPVIHVEHDCSVPVKMIAKFNLWRSEPYNLPEIGVSDLLEDRSKPGRLHAPVVIEPDDLIKNADDYIGFYHHNKKSVGFDLNMKLQGLSDYDMEDPILHRTFGAIIKGSKINRLNDNKIETKQAKKGQLDVYVLTKHPSQPQDWQREIEELALSVESIPFKERRIAHLVWWSEFWNRSWINASSSDSSKSIAEDDAYVVSRAYALQRFIDASAGRGKYPIKFNGSIFTVPSEGKPGNADYRRWGPGYWWQNSRLPYLSMCSSGDFEMMKPLFDMYTEEIYKLSKYRTKKYFGFDGIYFPECMNFWGSTFSATYGWTPYEEREDPLQESGWHKWEWVSGPELVFMMLDYYDYTQDKDFLNEKVVPLANDIMKFFDNYYKTNENGKLVMYPSMACETWWDCTNPMPELAGLHAITKRLISLSGNLTSEKDKEFWKIISAKLPEIPLRETSSGTALAPAERFEDKRNVENPELYAVFPFRLFGVGNPNIEWGKNALEHRWDKGDFGWRQDDIFMTYLGLTDQARKNLVGRASTYDKNSRFPAFWGPNYDWTPDQDHGGVMMKAFQTMMMQADPYSEKIYLTPAWPKDWNADFKLHAPYQTVIEGSVINGKLELKSVTPESRRKDIVVCNN